MKAKAAKKASTKPEPYNHDVNVCINKMVKEAKKNDPDLVDIHFELSGIQRFGATPRRYKTGQGVKVYRKTKTGSTKASKTFVTHKFCPFCGAKF